MAHEDEERAEALALEDPPDLLPEEWHAHEDESSGRVYYHNTETNETSWSHPLIDYFLGEAFMQRRGYQLLKAEEARHPPTDEEIADMADFLEIQEDDCEAVQDVARLAVSAPLPDGWSEAHDENGDTVFYNEDTQEEVQDHPLDNFFHELIRRRRLEHEEQDSPGGRASRASGAASRRRLVDESDGDGDGDEEARAEEGGGAKLRQRDTLSARAPASEHEHEEAGGPPRTAGAEQAQRNDTFDSLDEIEKRMNEIEKTESVPKSRDAFVSSNAIESALQGGDPFANVGSGAGGAGGGGSGTHHRASNGGAVHGGAHGAVDAPVPAQHYQDGFAADESVMVVVRARPPERASQHRAWIVDESNGAVFVESNTRSKYGQAFYLGGEQVSSPLAGPGDTLSAGAKLVGENDGFSYDSVFAELRSTEAMYNTCLNSFVHSALQGINSAVIAYGQTGTGKTHTIFGSRKSPGVIQLAIREVFDVLKQMRRCTVRVSMVEIYREELRDLLAPPPARNQPPLRLQIKEDAVLGAVVSGMRKEAVESESEVLDWLERGMQRRHVRSTNLNERSSRSHVIFQLSFEGLTSRTDGTDRRGGAYAGRISVLNFVDLAGSERLSKSGSNGVTQSEAQNINKSLLALGNVVARLADAKDGGRGEYLPYRDSKLTRILQHTLGGNARTAIVATINPSLENMDESLHTLRFATRARAVKNRIRVNVALPTTADGLPDGEAESLIAVYKEQVQKLNRRLEQNISQSELSKLRKELKLSNQEIKRLRAELNQGGGGGGGGGGESGSKSNEDDSLPGAWQESMSALHEALKKNLPPSSVVAEISAAKAIAQISRALGTSRTGGREPCPGEVASAARACRAERDELRRQNSRHTKVVEGLRSSLEREHGSASQLKSLVENIVSLEEILGDGTVSGNLAQRLEECCNAAAVCMAEVASLKRAYDEALSALDDSRRTEVAARERVESQGERVVEAANVEKKAALLSEQLAKALSERDAFCTELGKDVASLNHPSASQTATLEQFNRLEDEKAKLEASLATEQNQRDKLNAQLTEAKASATAELAEGGSAAVRAAKKALHDKRVTQERVDELASKKEELERLLQEAEAKAKALADAKSAPSANSEAGASSADGGAATNDDRSAGGASQDGARSKPELDGPKPEGEDGPPVRTEADFEALRKRLYAFSREITYVTRERDQLLMQVRVYQQRLVREGGDAEASVPAPLGAAAANNADDPSRLPPIGSRRQMMQAAEASAVSAAASISAAEPSRPKKVAAGSKEWTGAVDRTTDTQAELSKMRKRVVGLERERERMQQQLQAQTRAAQLNQQNQERNANKQRAVAQQLSELQALNTILSNDLKQLRADKQSLQSALDELVDDKLLRVGDIDDLDGGVVPTFEV